MSISGKSRVVLWAVIIVLVGVHSSFGEPLCWVEQDKLLALDGTAGDRFGWSVAVSDNIRIVGAPYDDECGTNAGAVYLFDVTTGEQLVKIKASDCAAGDMFGWFVAIENDIAIVGAPIYVANPSGPGSAYLFDVSDPENPIQTYKLTASDAAAGDLFGFSVAISGNIAIVGAQHNDDKGTESGSAYLFDVATGSQLSKFDGHDTTSYDEFGQPVAISGTTAVVGAACDDDQGYQSGSVYLFDVSDPENPVETSKITDTEGASEDYFGMSLSISGDTLIVGTYATDNAGTNSGSAWLFDVSDPWNPVETYKLTASDAASYDWFGAVSISGNTAIVGACGDDDNGDLSGSAYLFDVSDLNNPVAITKLTASDASAGDRFGRSVAISNNSAIVGAVHYDDPFTGSGTAYVFKNVCDVLIEVPMKFTPQALNVASKGRWVKAHMVLPEEYALEDVDCSSPALLEPGSIESDCINAFINDGGLVEVEIAFDRMDLCNALADAGDVEVMVIGSFISGGYFYGTDTIKVR